MKPSSFAGIVARVVVLAGLGGLTFVNATRSRALVEASEAESKGDFVAALRGATEHLSRRPWSLEAGRIMARCLSRLDFAEEAEPYYQAALGAGLATADLRYRAYGLTRANLRERALRAFDDVLARDPDDLASLRLKAGLLISMERWDGRPGHRPEAVGRSGRAVDVRLAGLGGGALDLQSPRGGVGRVGRGHAGGDRLAQPGGARRGRRGL